MQLLLIVFVYSLQGIQSEHQLKNRVRHADIDRDRTRNPGAVILNLV